MSKHNKGLNQAMLVDISKVLDENEVDEEVDREHPPADGVEKPGNSLLLAVTEVTEEIEQAGAVSTMIMGSMKQR